LNVNKKQIIAPVKTIGGHLTQHLEDFTIIVYPFIEGQNGFSRSLADNQLWPGLLLKTLGGMNREEMCGRISWQCLNRMGLSI